MVDNKKIGLALGSGGARGLAHIGVIKVLEQNNIPIDFIAGTSMGAIIGGVYASHKNIKLIEDSFLATDWKRYIKLTSDLSIFSGGLVAGEKIKNFIQSELECAKEFSDLKIPFAAVATNMENGEPVTFRTGSLADAIRASLSFPGVLSPAEINGQFFIDGGAVNPVPVEAVKKMGADIIIAVNLEERGGSYLHPDKGSKKLSNNLYSAVRIMQRKLANYCCVGASIVISPAVDKYNWIQFMEAKDIISAGEKSTVQALEKIKSLL
ncbi:patatin family protein [Candidatus Kuenenbacteria bacterium]|nr:patatin family protein [Candidatus Kuenenbacteria bacterium]